MSWLDFLGNVGENYITEGDYGASTFDLLDQLSGVPGAISPGGALEGVVSSTGNIVNAAGDIIASPKNSFENLLDVVKSAGKTVGNDALDFLKNNYGKLGLAGLMAYLAAQKATPARGGGTSQAYQGPAPLTRTMTQGKYGPIAQYAANGGLMHAYAHGGAVRSSGHVNMEDGGFVMTKRAVDGAGGHRGLASLLPGARPIRGPGTGTSDDIPATIHGPHGQTPARVSNGEAYVPRHVVDRAGGPQKMYGLMNALQRRA